MVEQAAFSNMSSPDVIILDANQRSSLAVTRSLGRAGTAVTVADSRPWPLAGASRYSRETLQYPPPATEPAAFRAWLRGLNVSYAGAVLLPTTDDTVPICLEEKSQLSALHLPFPPLDAYRAVSDKFALFEHCRHLSIDVPETALLTPGAPPVLATWAHHFPLVVKPRWSATVANGKSLRQPVGYAGNSAELEAAVANGFAEGAPALLVQEYVTGEGRGVFGLYDHGRRVAVFAHRRLREKPPSGGVSVLSESIVADAELVRAMDRLLAPLGWHGVAMAEFKLTPAGRAVLIEVNARFWGSLQLAVDAGVDFPRLLYELATGGQPRPPAGYTIGRRLRWLLGDLDHSYLLLKDRSGSIGARRKAAAIGRSLWPWFPNTGLETFRASDPMPFVAELRQYVAGR
jgi:predicted ATP-grasp superfamily ATP-dependent carboligase